MKLIHAAIFSAILFSVNNTNSVGWFDPEVESGRRILTSDEENQMTQELISLKPRIVAGCFFLGGFFSADGVIAYMANDSSITESLGSSITATVCMLLGLKVSDISTTVKGKPTLGQALLYRIHCMTLVGLGGGIAGLLFSLKNKALPDQA